jgi:hypothetical protein
MASHAIFQYNVLAIDDTHNTWTNICVEMIIIRLIGLRDEKIQNPEEIGQDLQQINPEKGKSLSPVKPTRQRRQRRCIPIQSQSSEKK